jgi:CubicO group peptidase (beta-lactamase class C family)
MTRTIDDAFKSAISQGVFPAAELLVAKGGSTVLHSYYGDAREDTCFDVASLTKPIATVSIAMMLTAEGLIKYEDTVYQWLAGARQPVHKKMTVRHLLNHTSGLPSWQPYYQELPISLVGTEAGKRLMLDSCYSEPLEAEVGEKTIYSDIGYMILGEILEQAGDGSLDVLFSKYVARPLGLSNSFYVRIVGNPLSSSKKTASTASKHIHIPPQHKTPEKYSDHEHRRFAPTEDCPWRGRVIHGEVHDQNAYALGGIAGHAGLFSTAKDLSVVALELAKCYRGQSQWLPQNVVQEFLQEGKQKPAGNEFVLGWNRPSRKNSASGHHFSPNTIGHLGYTGCSIWMDLNQDYLVILLTNRIHPSITNQKISAFRPQIHDLIFEELIK